MIRLFIYFVELRWRRAATLQPAAAQDIGHYIYCGPAAAGTWHDMTWHVARARHVDIITIVVSADVDSVRMSGCLWGERGTPRAVDEHSEKEHTLIEELYLGPVLYCFIWSIWIGWIGLKDWRIQPSLHLSSVGAPVWYNDDREHDYGRDPAILLLMCSSEEKRMIPFL